MGWNGSGTFTRLYSWVARSLAGPPTKTIDAASMDAEFDNFKTGLENCLTKTGETTPTANQPMGGYLHTNAGAATARTNYGRVAEIQDATIWKAASVGGSGDAMTGTLAPAPIAYTYPMLIIIAAPGANSVNNPTININSIGAKTIRKHQGTLAVPDYSTGDILFLLYDGTGCELLNPKNAASTAAVDLNSFTTDSTGGATADFLPFVDASESNASNKVLVTDLLKNLLANVAADATIGATGDKLLFADADESSGTANTGTVDNFIKNVLALLTTDSTLGDVADYAVGLDASESNAGNKALVSDFMYNMLNTATADAAPDLSADHLLSRDNSASAIKKVLMKYIGAGLQTIGIPAGAMKSRTTNGPSNGNAESATNKVMQVTLDFDASTQEHAQAFLPMPRNWDLGTVTVQFGWRATNTGNVVWGAQGVAISDDDVYDAAFGTAQEVTDGVTATTDLMWSAETAAITIGGTPAQGDQVVIQFYRKAADASDTCAVDALLVAARIRYTTNANTDA